MGDRYGRRDRPTALKKAHRLISKRSKSKSTKRWHRTAGRNDPMFAKDGSRTRPVFLVSRGLQVSAAGAAHLMDLMDVREGDVNESLVVIRRRRRAQFVRGFGPGLVSGASANDPTTVGTIAVVAAATGYAMGWLVVLLLPLLAIVQSIAASIATVSQTSLQEAILSTFGRRAALAAAMCVASVGLFTLAADMQAG